MNEEGEEHPKRESIELNDTSLRIELRNRDSSNVRPAFHSGFPCKCPSFTRKRE